MIEFVRQNDEVKVQINNLEYDISGDNWITLHPLQKCKSEDEASWLCSILNDAMERHERIEELREVTKPTQLYFDSYVNQHFGADPEEIKKAVSDFNYDILNRKQA